MSEGITLRYLQNYIRAKDFQPEHTQEYFLKLSEEMGELARVLRRGAPPATAQNIKGTVEEEIWDCIYYLLAIANCRQIDIEQWIPVKEAINNQKYNTGLVFGEPIR